MQHETLSFMVVNSSRLDEFIPCRPTFKKSVQNNVQVVGKGDDAYGNG